MTTATRAAALATTFSFVLLSGCGRGEQANDGQANSAANANTNVAANANTTDAAGAADFSTLDAEVGQLEKRAERNPGDDETLAALARAYVRRGNAHRAANRLREALLDYRRAQNANPDDEAAQRAAAEISTLVEGERTGENGEPAPLPITPGVTDDEEKAAPTPTPKKQ
jgi:cytochrome c-type biogenesis protein CcmH/NrfG